jgi:chromosome partitioning protein
MVVREVPIISIVNDKGGVGKTVTAVNLGAALAMNGKRVLLVDLDPQASATASLGLNGARPAVTLPEVLTEGREVAKAIISSTRKNLDVVPGDTRMKDVNIALASRIGRERILESRLAPVKVSYDFVLIDCPPSISLLTLNAIVASDYVLIPVIPDFLSVNGLVELQAVLKEVAQALHVQPRVLGIVPTIVDFRNAITSEVLALLRSTYKELVTKTEIRVNVKLREAPGFGQTIFEYDPHSTGAENYRALAEEVLQRCRRSRG